MRVEPDQTIKVEMRLADSEGIVIPLTGGGGRRRMDGCSIKPLGTSLPLVVTREQVTYYETEAPQLFEMGGFPVWIWMDDPSFYGFPTFGRAGVKISQDCGGSPVDPNTRGFDPDPRSWRAPTHSLRRRSLGLSARHCRRPHVSTRLPPTDFVVDALPDHPNVHVALGAGHGYKFVAWFGRTLAALAGGRDPGCDLAPFRLDRPALTDPTWEANWLV